MRSLWRFSGGFLLFETHIQFDGWEEANAPVLLHDCL
jgi:hypothetical protein